MRALLALLALVFTAHAAEGPWDLAALQQPPHATDAAGLKATSEHVELAAP